MSLTYSQPINPRVGTNRVNNRVFKEAENAVNFLNTEIVKTNFSEIKEVIAQLLQQETQKLTLIEANKYYVYEFIDPPFVGEKKAEPSRALICIFGFVIGLVIGIIYVIVINMKNINSNPKFNI